MPRRRTALPRPALRTFPVIGSGALEATLEPDGVLLGATTGGQDVRMHLFRERVGSMILLADLPVAAVLVLRVLATGATVSVRTSRPPAWESIRDLAGVDPARWEIGGVDAAVTRRATFAEPLLVLQDAGTAASPIRLMPGPWRTAVTMVDGVTPGVLATARSASVIVSQRMSARSARRLAVDGLRQPEEAARMLTRLRPGELALLTDRGVVAVTVPLAEVHADAVHVELARVNPRTLAPWRAIP